MLISKPIAHIEVHNDEPPYDKKSSGIPVIGIMPITMPTLMTKWKKNKTRMPTAI